MRVLKVTAEGLTTSFRYPHFMHGVQPTYEMPPPATIYGHICSALGDWISPEGVQFAYHFTYQARFDDVEHVHLVAVASGVLRDTRIPKVMEGAVNPFKRQLLFGPRLVLYLNHPEWEAAFRSPRYPVALGRSQDLFTYTEIGVVELEQAGRAYFEHTLAPYRFALQAQRGYVVLMPRYLDYERRRQPSFARYLVLHERIPSHGDGGLLRFEGMATDSSYWVDPTSPEIGGARLGLLFHAFVGEYDDNPVVA